jgi:hypothetical protein
VAGIGARLGAFPGGIPGLWTLGPVAGDAPSRRPIVRLLGHFDTYLLGYRRREHMGDAAAEHWIHKGGGWIRPVVCVDGWIVGGWRLESRGAETEVTVTPFVRLPTRVAAGIQGEVDSISRFLVRPVRWTSEALVG